MLDYIVKEPPPNSDEKRCYRYPFIASEIFSCDLKEIGDKFFRSEENRKEVVRISIEQIENNENQQIIEMPVAEIEEKKEINPELPTQKQEEEVSAEKAEKKRLPLLEKLLSLLDPKEEINPVLAGYFAKITLSIIEKQELDFLSYVFAFPEHVQNVIKHIYNKSIADVLLKIISKEGKYFSGITGDEFIYQKMEIVDQLIDNMEPSNSSLTITNGCNILVSLIESKQHLAYFTDTKVLKRILYSATSKNITSVISGLAYLSAIIKLKIVPQAEQAYFQGIENIDSDQKDEEEIEKSEVISLIAENLGFYKNSLEVLLHFQNI